MSEIKNILLENKKIAIVGGGPGGLTLARLLQLKGADVKVYERDFNEKTRVQGAIVDLHFESGLLAIKKADLLNEFKANYMPGADKYRVVDKHANIQYDEQGEEFNEDFDNEQFRPEIDRGALRNILLESLQPDTVVWDSQFVDMVQVDNVWKLEFKNGTTATADIVIGSDGARSKIRPYITGIKPQYSGVTIIQGEIENPEKDCPEIYAMINNANMIALSDMKNISMQPRGDGGLTFYASAKYPEDWFKNSGIDFNNKKEVSSYLKEFYEGWNQIFFTLFDACNKFVLRPLTYVSLDQDWTAQSNITIIGDAAHIMPPSGEGVNTAMLDALDLSECLTNNDFPNLQTAISAYEKQMRTRAAKLAQESLDGTEQMYSKDALTTLIDQFNQMPRKEN